MDNELARYEWCGDGLCLTLNGPNEVLIGVKDRNSRLKQQYNLVGSSKLVDDEENA